MNVIRYVLSGMIIGVANIIPGVSGGTMAVILKVFDRLIETLSLKNLKKNIPFILPLGIGAGIGILLFSKAIKYLLANYPIAINFAFIGLILGSIPMVYGLAKKGGNGRVRPVSLIPFAVAFAVMVAITLVDEGQIVNSVRTTLDVGTAVWLIAVSAASAFAMILPGISGSFVMLVLGAYTTVLTAISDLNIAMLIPVAVGCLVGLLAGSKLVDVLMHRFPQPTYFAILGLIAGSLIAIYPGFALTLEGLIAVLLLAACAVGVYWFSKMGE